MSEQSYIVRIYRRSGELENKDGLDGIVEIPESGRRAAFHDAQGLWDILSCNALPKLKRKRTRKCRNEC